MADFGTSKKNLRNEIHRYSPSYVMARSYKHLDGTRVKGHCVKKDLQLNERKVTTTLHVGFSLYYEKKVEKVEKPAEEGTLDGTSNVNR
jgi:hypothetical protein